MDEFFKVYIGLIKKMQNLTKTEILVLFHLGMMMSYKNNLLWEKDLQEILSFNLKMERRTLQNIISRLINKGYLRREGFYLIIDETLLKKGR